MILVDANILLFACDSASPHHERARAWVEEALNGEETVGLALASLLAFVRIGSDPRVFRRPFHTPGGVEIVASWLSRSNVVVAQPTDGRWDALARVARLGKARGSLVMDAHLASLALEHGATLFTTDRDFARFPGLRSRDPLA